MKKFKRITSMLLTFLFLATLSPKYQINANAEVLPAADLAVTLVGNIIKDNGLGTDWEPTNNQSLLKEYKNGIYEITIDFKAAKADGLYKVALNRTWDKSYGDVDGPEGNKKINVTAPGKVIFRFNSKTSEVFDSINNPDQFKTSASLVGTFKQSGGSDWTPADTKFTLDYIGGGFYKKTFSLKKGNYEYKTVYNGAYDNGDIASNVAMSLATDSDVTFLSNPIEGICTDSISNPLILGSLSLIGTIRGGNGDWDQTSKNYDFTNLSGDGKYVYSGFFAAGEYEYKGVEDYAWAGDGLPTSGNVKITIPEGGKYIVFAADRVSRTLVDSINNPDEVALALGLKSSPEVPVVAKSPVFNANGSVTFNYQNINAKQVYLVGDMTSWADNKKEMTLIDAKNGIFSITLRLDDAAKDYEYKFIIDGVEVKDPLNLPSTGENSILKYDGYTGRKVVLAGTIQGIDGSGTWDPGSDKTKLNYDGNGNYSLTLKDVPAGNYEYKIAMGSWDPENYGANGVAFGTNISLIVPVKEDVTFWYNDDSHNIVDSTYYKMADIDLKGIGIPSATKLTDATLSGIYSTKVILNKGTYSDVKAVLDGKEYTFGKVEITTDTKNVTFSFDATTLMTFTDASDTPIEVNKLYFDSRDAQYKSPYGATPTSTEIIFNLKTGADVSSAKMVLITPTGIKLVDMTKGVAFNEASNKWTGKFKSDTIGQFKYYFVVSNGSDVKAYGDDDGFFGPGKAGQIGTVGYYDLNIYDKNFKTPDWIKNSVVYQIFPDRFFNGDVSNDYEQELARGTTPYEHYDDWYAIPENPTLEFIANKDGSQSTEPNPDYKGTKGDGVWANEMYGGDLKGIQDKLDYLQAVGVNTLYMTPISKSISNHRYDATDYKELDPLLGHMEEFVNLAKEAHKRDMHMIIDGVFNHVSDDSIYFDRYEKYLAKNKPIGAYQYWSRVYDLMNKDKVTQQVAEKQVTADLKSQGITDLHYKDWFIIKNVKVAALSGDPEHYEYEGWAGYSSMPVNQALNGSEYNVETWADEVIDGPDANTRLWLQNGSDGWRLDVANEVSDETWRKFRTAVKEEGDNVIIGEIWSDASKYILGDMYDSVMNYRFRDAVLGFVQNIDNSKNISAVQAMNQLEAMREQYPREAFEAMMNLVGSHDTQRVISNFDGAEKSVKAISGNPSDTALEKIKLIPLIQMTYPGAPTIYYGDEAAMPGADDPDNRRGMIWGKGDKSTVEWYAKLAHIRNAYSVLRTGDIVPITVDETNKADVMAYSRNDNDNHAVIAINRRNVEIKGVVLDSNAPAGTVLTNALNPAEKYTVDKDGKVTVNLLKYSGVVLVAEYTAAVVKTEDLRDIYDASYIVPKIANDTTPPVVTPPVVTPALTSERLSGANRIETSIAIAKKQYTEAKPDAVVLATANDFADALVGSGLAYKYNAPMLLVNKSVSTSKNVLDYIKANLSKDKNIYILGETGAVSSEISDYLSAQGYKIIRLGGSDRYVTNKKVVETLDVAKGTSMVIATGTEFADALSISSIAAKNGFPVLLNARDNLSASVRTYIKNLQPANIYVVGGEGVLSANIETQIKVLNANIKIIRLGGADRYETSIKIAEHFNLVTNTITVATGIKFPDALTGSVLAARLNSSILLVDNNHVTKQKALMNKQRITNVIVLGGEGAISAEVLNSLVQK